MKVYNFELDFEELERRLRIPLEIQEQSENAVFTVVEEAASFNGGVDGLSKYLSENLKYPTQAKDQGVEGVVYVQFIVEEDGSLSNVEILKGIGAGCDEEAKRIIEASPKWIPGKQQGKLVRQKMLQKLVFKL